MQHKLYYTIYTITITEREGCWGGGMREMDVLLEIDLICSCAAPYCRLI